MAFLKIENIAIKGIACAVPKRSQTSLEYSYFSENDRKMFISGTGVEARRIADETVCASDLCFDAAETLIHEMNIPREKIKILIFVSQSPDYFLPATAIILQNRLRLSKDCLAFDVGLGCSGYVYGLSVASSMLQPMDDGYALLLAGDKSTFSTHPKDKSTSPLFGDAGSATLLKKETTTHPMFFNLQSDGSGHEAIIIRGGGLRHPYHEGSRNETTNKDGIVHTELNLEMDGMAVFNFALKEVKPNVNDLMDFAGFSNSDIDYFVMHQANLFMNETVRKKLKIDREKTPYSLKDFGNTSSASIPLTMVTQLKEKLENSPQRLLLSGFGVGLSWGSVYFSTKNLIVPELIER